MLAAGVTAATALILVEVPAAAEAISSYCAVLARRSHRARGRFRVRNESIPRSACGAPSVAITRDLPLADSLGVDAIAIVVDPEGAHGKALDSLSHLVENIRDDSTALILTIGYPRDARDAFARAPRRMSKIAWPT